MSFTQRNHSIYCHRSKYFLKNDPSCTFLQKTLYFYDFKEFCFQLNNNDYRFLKKKSLFFSNLHEENIEIRLSLHKVSNVFYGNSKKSEAMSNNRAKLCCFQQYNKQVGDNWYKNNNKFRLNILVLILQTAFKNHILKYYLQLLKILYTNCQTFKKKN